MDSSTLVMAQLSSITAEEQLIAYGSNALMTGLEPLDVSYTGPWEYLTERPSYHQSADPQASKMIGVAPMARHISPSALHNDQVAVYRNSSVELPLQALTPSFGASTAESSVSPTQTADPAPRLGAQIFSCEHENCEKTFRTERDLK